MKTFLARLTFVLASLTASAEAPSNLVVENIPPFPPDLLESVGPYMESRSAALRDWHPTRREILITTRFGDVPQLHLVTMPGGARKQITFYTDRVVGGSFNPADGNTIVFTKDVGGGEFFQFYRFDRPTAKVTLLTDGKSRNTNPLWSRKGASIAWSSTRRNGKDTDVWIMNPSDPSSAKMLLELQGGGWGAADWSPDDSKLVVLEYIAADESYLWLAEVASGKKTLLTPKEKSQALYADARFAADGKSLFVVTDAVGEFQHLYKMDLASGAKRSLTPSLKWDVDAIELSDDGKRLAYVTNEAGVGVLHLLDTTTEKGIPLPPLPLGTITTLSFHNNNNDLAFTMSSAKSPTDVFSIDLTTGKLDRWTESETGGLDTSTNVEPELVRLKSFDGVEISAFVYRPDPGKFPGKRPVIVNIHGGPEGQARPGFLGRANYLINELGIAWITPNVRGSSGYGKTFMTLDNEKKREDSVRDIGAILDWIGRDSRLAAERIGITGGSYGGYMTLAVSTHYADRIRAAIDIVGISNFVTFLENTQDYRRDLRRVEYGDERNESMRAFLSSISPLTNAAKIKKPLFVVQGFNDPRVPHTEAGQILKAVRENGVPVWFLMAKDEGHGFAKKQNQDYQFLASLLFWKEHLLK